MDSSNNIVVDSSIQIEDVSANVLFFENLIATDSSNNIDPTNDLNLQMDLLTVDNITLSMLENDMNIINTVSVSEIINQIETKINSSS